MKKVFVNEEVLKIKGIKSEEILNKAIYGEDFELNGTKIKVSTDDMYDIYVDLNDDDCGYYVLVKANKEDEEKDGE